MEIIDRLGEAYFDGYAVKDWLSTHADIAIYIAGLYLTFVFKGPVMVEKLFGGGLPWMRKVWVLWNILLSVFSIYGTIRISPVLLSNFATRGFHDTLCTFREEEYYTTRVGFAMGIFSLSKLPEFGDSFFLIMTGKKQLPFLQWFHHVTIFLCAWQAYADGSSIFICLAAMNYPVHAIMYCYFALAEAGYKKEVRPAAMYITMMQICQMIGGLIMTGSFIYYQWTEGENACGGTSMSVARSQLFIYVANFYLFSKMFLEGYTLSFSSPPH